MKGLPDTPEDYFDRFSTGPVTIYPFDPQSKQVANGFLERLRRWLEGLDVEVLHRGSTAFEIAGKGDIEFGVYPSDEDWSTVLERLGRYCGGAGNIEKNYVRFNDAAHGYEIEVIVLRGHDAQVDKRLSRYLLEHPGLLKEYEHLKRKYAFSRREYQRQKDKFLRRVVAMIPDD